MPPRHRPSVRAVAMLAAALALPGAALAGCGKDNAGTVSKKANAAVSQQVGLAAGTARQKLFAPTVEASLKKGAPNRKQALADAGTASEYVVRSLAQAQRAAVKDPKLKDLASKLQNAGASIGALTVVLRSGKTPPTSLLTGSLGTIQSVENAVKDAGIPLKDRAATDLGS